MCIVLKWILKVFYIEMVCNDEELITENIKVVYRTLVNFLSIVNHLHAGSKTE